MSSFRTSVTVLVGAPRLHISCVRSPSQADVLRFRVERAPWRSGPAEPECLRPFLFAQAALKSAADHLELQDGPWTASERRKLYGTGPQTRTAATQRPARGRLQLPTRHRGLGRP